MTGQVDQPERVDQPDGTARLDVTVPAHVTRRRALALLADPGRGAWLGEAVERADDGTRQRHLLDLELRVTDHTPRIAFHKAALVDIGTPRGRHGRPIEVEIGWRAAGLAPLFPVFSGTLSWSDGQLRVAGFYAPPGGGIGIMADRLLLNVAARGTARVLLERIAGAMLAEPG